MYEDVLRERLKNLYSDLTCTGEEAVSLVNFMTCSIDDKVTVIRDMYFHDNAPVKVLNTEFGGKGKRYDYEDEVIAVSEGYDHFIRKIGVRTTSVLNKHFSALSLFICILNLPYPYSSILYLRFFKNSSIDQVCKDLFMSRSSCYRKQERGIALLLKKVNGQEE